MLKFGVIDPTKVTRSALQNAASIGALFLTTEAVVADKPEKTSGAGHARWRRRHGLLVLASTLVEGALRGPFVVGGVPRTTRRTEGHIFATTRDEPSAEVERTNRWSPSLRRNGPDPIRAVLTSGGCRVGRPCARGTIAAMATRGDPQAGPVARGPCGHRGRGRGLFRRERFHARRGRRRPRPGDRALAITAVSPSLPPGEADEARRVAGELGILHRTVRTREAERPAYLANGIDRCYHCKTELYDVLARVARRTISRSWCRARTWTTSATSGPDWRPLPNMECVTRSSRWRCRSRMCARRRVNWPSPHGTSRRPRASPRGSRSG